MQGACDHYRLQVLLHCPDTPRLLNGCGSLLDESTEWTEWKTPEHQDRIGFCLICRPLIVSAVRYLCSNCWPHFAFASDNLNTTSPDNLIIDAQTRQYELWYTTVPK